MRKYNWPYDAATTIAVLALTVSSLQFILTTPLFMGFYFQSALKIRGGGSPLDSDFLAGVFILQNSGRSPATNVEIGLVLQEHQRISIMPKIKSEIIGADNTSYFPKNVRIEIPQLNAGEELLIAVVPDLNNTRLDSQTADMLRLGGVKEIPFVSYIKSEQGKGENLTGTLDQLGDASMFHPTSKAATDSSNTRLKK